MLTWYALNTKPRSERVVCEALAARGFESYLPLWTPARPGPHSPGSVPFFPGYLFARADLDLVGISALQYLAGVRHLVFCGDQPARVPQAAIEQIRSRICEMEKSQTDALGQLLMAGDRVIITGGPLAGFEASIDCRLSSSERVRLLVDFLQTGAHLEIDREFVRRTFSKKSNPPLPRSSPRYNVVRGGIP